MEEPILRYEKIDFLGEGQVSGLSSTCMKIRPITRTHMHSETYVHLFTMFDCQ